ncbi:recombinase family protein [Salmonella enterica subsp. enterica serovar Braenderup]|nr:recombinase family protein [Salmonella enterica subsp. enterica serovar Braenderup]
MRTFAYCRVSTDEQTTENQIEAIKRAGYDVRADRIVSEVVSGTKPAMQRLQFVKLVDKLEKGDCLVVLKIDRLGRDNIDVQQTITMLIERGINVVSLDLPERDLSTPAGKMMLQMMAVFAEFERNKISERTKEALTARKAQGMKLGRPEATDTYQQVQALKQAGYTQAKAAKSMGVSVRTVSRHWTAAEPDPKA